MATKVRVRYCPICGYTTAKVLITQRFVIPKDHPLGDVQDIVCCDWCDFVYADVSATQEDYDLYYAHFSKYEDSQTPMGGGTIFDDERLTRTAEYITHALPDRRMRILDVGCANGTMLGALKQFGYVNLCGVDLSPGCVESTKRRYDIKAHVGSLSDLSQGIGKFDFVILSHVLEHVKELRQALYHVRELLPASGYLYVEVPDASRYADFVFSPFQDFNTEHINHFSLQGLTNLLRICGFNIKDAGHKLIEAAPGIAYPVVFTTAVKMDDNEPPNQIPLGTDEQLKRGMQAYIDTSQQMMDKIGLKLRNILSEQSSVIVWGTGQLVMKLLAETALAEANIKAFVDSNPVNQGQVLRGIPILAPEQIIGMTDPIIVGSTLHYEAIYKRIREQMKLPNDVIGLV